MPPQVNDLHQNQVNRRLRNAFLFLDLPFYRRRVSQDFEQWRSPFAIESLGDSVQWCHRPRRRPTLQSTIDSTWRQGQASQQLARIENGNGKTLCDGSQRWRFPHTSTGNWNWWSRWRTTDTIPSDIVFRYCQLGKQQQSTVSQGVVTSRFEKVFRFWFYFNYRYAQRLRKVQVDYRFSSLVLIMIPNDVSSSKSGESTDNGHSVSHPSNQTSDPVSYSFRLVHRLGGQRPNTWWSNV